MKKTPLQSLITGKIKLNDRVKVVAMADDTGLPEHMGKFGKVLNLRTDGACGCSPTDPFISVQFDDGTKDSFWREELAAIEPLEEYKQ